jgi:hypothetical protein
MAVPEIPAQQRLELYNSIEQLIREVRLCKSLEDFSTVHQHLGEHIERIADSIRIANERQGKKSRQLRKLYRKNTSETKDAIVLMRAERARAELDHDVYHLLAREYRMVGDALAWKIPRDAQRDARK